MVHFDFIEIGTCDFDTMLHAAGDAERGLAVEPLAMYLEGLPDRPNVTKVQAAVSSARAQRNLRYVAPVGRARAA